MGDSSSSASSYIHLVQHLIEKCLIFHMTKEECMAAVSKHANINPIITSTVWDELEKVNKEFFESYMKSKSGKEKIMLQRETTKMLQKIISASDSSKDDSKEKMMSQEETTQMIQNIISVSNSSKCEQDD